ncbi:MAG: hypothetical protein GX630_02945 [Actinobacteria bacterium]|nr:hypothetical protein [Actinomycetota bacterium]
MAEPGCGSCPMRTKYDANPKSFGGRLWRWHINFCPGWKKYFTALPQEEKATLAAQYRFKKYQ